MCRFAPIHSKDFQRGFRVVSTPEATRFHLFGFHNKEKKYGRVAHTAQPYRDCVAVVLDGNKTLSYYSKTFWNVVGENK